MERHPRIGFFDLKYFFEGRPGLTAWTCLSFVFMLAQVGGLCFFFFFNTNEKKYDKYGTVSPAMVICALLHALYNIDALYYEEVSMVSVALFCCVISSFQGMLTMLDIVYDPFGWMLAFGDIAYVPFLYPLSTLYLIDHSPSWHPAAFVAVALLGMFAYYAFREVMRRVFCCSAL